MSGTSHTRRLLLGLSGIVATLLLPRRAAAAEQPIAQPAEASPRTFPARALALRDAAIAAGDQGYGAVIVRDGRIVGEAPSRVVINRDPTAHAEMEAIRDAARRLGTRDLSGAVMYGSSSACPMCRAAAYWANIAGLYYGAGPTDGGKPGL